MDALQSITKRLLALDAGFDQEYIDSACEGLTTEDKVLHLTTIHDEWVNLGDED